MTSLTVTELRSNLYKIVDQVLETGEPVEIVRGGRRLRLVAEPVPVRRDLSKIPVRNSLNCTPEELEATTWEYDPTAEIENLRARE